MSRKLVGRVIGRQVLVSALLAAVVGALVGAVVSVALGGSEPEGVAGAAERALIERFYEESWNNGDISLIDELFTTDYVLHMQDGRTIGRDGFKIEIPELRSSFPDLSITADEWIMAPGKIIARVTWRGTHTGQGLGIQPSGNEFEASAIYIYRFEGNRIVESWAMFDSLGFRQQLGLL